MWDNMWKKGNMNVVILSSFFAVIIILTLVFLPLLNYSVSLGQSSFFQREFIVRDVGLMLDALRASPNDVYIEYQEKSEKLTIDINKEYVQAYSYNVDPKKSNSKISKYGIFPSGVAFLESSFAPEVRKDDKGDDIVTPFRLYFTKDSDGIHPSSVKSNIPAEDNPNDCKYGNIIKEVNEGTYSTLEDTNKKALVIFYPEIKNQRTELLNNLENGFATRPTFFLFKDDTCTNGCVTKANADMIIIIYSNLKASLPVNIYSVGSDAESLEMSERLDCFSTAYIKDAFSTITTITKNNQIPDYIKNDLASILNDISSKPTIIIEVGDDVSLSGGRIYEELVKAVEGYYGIKKE